MKKRGLHLKKIEMCGFKSFADRTVFQFGEGVSGIVGPNGCGKSNVADAFRWVMGEQSAKSMRGEKMHDVIFAGTAKRKPGNFSEVTLTFTNASASLPVEFDEISVTRRLTRAGESEYRLNGNTVRMKDIHGLFWDSGVGKDAFAVFEQGRIDEIILRSPEERRPIIEQVAGIHRYRKQWQEAERKLAQTELNLSRVGDVVSEVAKQLRVLERQVKEAQAFKSNKERLQELEQGLIVARWKRADAQRQKLSAELAALHERLGGQAQAQEELDGSLVALRGEVATREKELQALTEEVYRVRSEREVKAVEGQTSQKRLQEADEREGTLAEDFSLLGVQRGSVKEELKQKREELRALKGSLKEGEKSLTAATSAFEKLQAGMAKLREQEQKVQRLQLELSERAHGLAAQLHERGVRLETAQARAGVVADELEGVEQQKGAIEKANRTRKGQVGELSAQVDKAKGALGETESALGATSSELEKARQDLELAHMELAEAVARDRVLRRLKEEMEGLATSAKKLLKEAKFKGKLRPLYEAVSVKEGMGEVMRAYSGTLLADSAATLKAVWEHAEEKGLAGFSLFFKKGKLTPDHFGATEGVSKADLFKGKAGLTSSGAYCDPNGVIFSPAKGEASPFAREAELKKLGTTITAKESEKKRLSKRIEALREQQQKLSEKRAVQDREHRALEMRLVEANFTLQRGKSELEELGAVRTRLQAEGKELASRCKELEKERARLEAQTAKAQQQLQEQQASFEGVEQQLQGMLTSLRDAGEAKTQAEVAFAAVDEQAQALRARILVLESKEEEYTRQHERIQKDREGLAAKRKELKASIASYGKLLSGVEGELKSTSSRCERLERELSKLKEKLSKAEERVQSGADKRRSLEEKCHAIEIAIAGQVAHCDDQAEELTERFGLKIDEAKERDFHLRGKLEDSERELRDLRRSVERADHVNMAAIDEFEECQERHTHLTTQTADLEKTKQELEQIIAELDKSSREKYLETFQKVRENFQKQFQILFKGGEADLKFVGSNDPLEAGIDLVAKPPGKKMRSIKLLSGGEKCMTAMALLFAIFEVKPAPFCLLDEMDAPLDDANVQRFLDVLRPFMEETQFIIITHNKLTMAEADVLYGVTMEEKGVSKQISIKFEKKREAVLA